jgi:chromatin assembly factor 1 subunit A
MMASFFGKPKAASSAAKAGPSSSTPSRLPTEERTPKKVEDEFSKTFRPFVIKKDAEVAPVNCFLAKQKVKGKGKQRAREVIDVDGQQNAIVISDEEISAESKDVEMGDPFLSPRNLSGISDRGDFCSVIYEPIG